MTSKVAIVEFGADVEASVKQALDLIGGADDLNTAKKPVVIKVGVFSHKGDNHTSVDMVNGIINCFNKAPEIFVAESDNYKGKGLERLQIWNKLFTTRIIPFNLSDDSDTKKVKVVDQEMNLSHILFKPNILVDTHIVRSFECGSILKNLFGCIPDAKRVKYHKVLPTLLADVYEAVGGIDLAVLDGTFFWHGAGNTPTRMNTVVVGRDAVAVEAIGAALAGSDPQKVPVIQEFMKRGLGEGELDNIKVVGSSLESVKTKFVAATATKKKRRAQGK